MFRISEAAARLGVSACTVRRWIDQGRLFAIRMPITGERRIPPENLDKLLSQMREDGRIPNREGKLDGNQ